ncbi:MAG: DUF4097 family beta strand repeat protein [Acidobacteria bacterium]|nr:DUF4097 family beta strand repeat protein [Acidobacteriota bacterium]
MHKRFTKLGLAVALLATICAAQQGSVQREGNYWSHTLSGSLAVARNLRIKVEAGAVRVEGTSSQAITYVVHNKSHESSEERARRQFDSYKISSYVRGDTAWVVGEWEGGRPHRFSSDITVRVPRAMDLVNIETDGGDVVATGISGRLEAETGGGAIHLDDIGGAINAETGGKSIDVGNAGGDVIVRTGGGAIHIGSAKGKIVAETGAGDVTVVSASQGASLQTGAGSIRVEKCTGQVKAETGGGSIDLGEIIGQVTMETGGGSLKINSATGLVNAETGGGSIELYSVPAARVETGAGTITAKFVASSGAADSQLETATGDVTVYLAPAMRVTLRASIEAASGHRIHSDFSEIRVSSEDGQWEPRFVSAEGRLNGGGPVLKIRTTMGNIYIRRAQ